MRDFTKSMFSFSWAMSLFSVQQALNLMSPSRATKAFDNVTGATREQFDDVLQATFRTGDNLQRGVVDMMLGAFTGQAFNPSRWARMTSDAVQQSADAMGQGMRAATSGQQWSSSGTQQSQGWGPACGDEGHPSYSQRRRQAEDWNATSGSDCDPCSGRR